MTMQDDSSREYNLALPGHTKQEGPSHRHNTAYPIPRR